ncbi:unnamed protein product [Somion occarium]|uniref:NAD(P)-binding protein n=1 Tax=Somion occarium TaxID=3059160 RepID=A0ABP1CZ51_9APHY
MVSYVVTGSNRGIGFAFVQKLSANPQNIVFALTRNKANSADLLELQSKLQNVHVLQADITDILALQDVAKEIEEVTGGTLDVLINNGAHLSPERDDYTLDAYDGKEDLLEKDFIDFFKVNTLGVIKTINVFLPLLRNASQKCLAKVITISAPAAEIDFNLKTGLSFWAPYAVSKAGVNMVTAKYAARFKDDNLVFLSLSPGPVNTLGDAPKEVQETAYGPLIEIFRSGYPEWDGEFLRPERSVSLMLDVISKITARDNGAFVSQYGNQRWL